MQGRRILRTGPPSKYKAAEAQTLVASSTIVRHAIPKARSTRPGKEKDRTGESVRPLAIEVTVPPLEAELLFCGSESASDRINTRLVFPARSKNCQFCQCREQRR